MVERIGHTPPPNFRPGGDSISAQINQHLKKLVTLLRDLGHHTVNDPKYLDQLSSEIQALNKLSKEGNDA